jgi:23S rRNA pseudouridine2605 synthase
MRLNRYVAASTGISRRAADEAISDGRVFVNGITATLGQVVEDNDKVQLDGSILKPLPQRAIILNKPVGYVSSSVQQDSSPTIYDLLPSELHHLKPVGRLDKDSSGLMVLTNQGTLAQLLGHPSAGKWKRYIIKLDKNLGADDMVQLQKGVELDDGISRLDISKTGRDYAVKLQEGRNRQIRRSFEALGYRVLTLHRTAIGKISLGELPEGQWNEIDTLGDTK